MQNQHNSNSRHETQRRQFIKRLGLCSTPPFFPFINQLAAQPSKPPKRLVCIGTEYGVYTPAFFPATTGTSYKLPELMQPLQTVRELFTVIEGLDHQLGGGTKEYRGSSPGNGSASQNRPCTPWISTLLTESETIPASHRSPWIYMEATTGHGIAMVSKCGESAITANPGPC